MTQRADRSERASARKRERELWAGRAALEGCVYMRVRLRERLGEEERA